MARCKSVNHFMDKELPFALQRICTKGESVSSMHSRCIRVTRAGTKPDK